MPRHKSGLFFMIEIDNISIGYHHSGKTVQAISSLSLHIKQGEYIAVLGPNGSGKSTLLKAICGLVPVDEGYIRMRGKTVRPGCFGDDFFGKVGIVFQEPEGQFLMRNVRTEINSVLQNLGLSIKIQQERFDSIVERFELADILAQKPENLSGGQMQLVNLACALAVEPDLLLLDEPTSFLDSYYQQAFLNHLESLNQAGLTIVHITQSSDEAARAGRIILLECGKLAVDCTPNEIWNNLDFAQSYKLQSPITNYFHNVFGFEYDDLEQVNAYCAKNKAHNSIDIIDPAKRTKVFPETTLTFENLRYRYSPSQFSIEIDRLEFSRGEVIGLIGATGSGKSTLAFLL
jgi:energy-coupling factor transporter ATP-binding protein EcfA2